MVAPKQKKAAPGPLRGATQPPKRGAPRAKPPATNPLWSRLASSAASVAPAGGMLVQRTNLSEPSVLAVIDKTLEQKGIAYATEVTMKVEAAGPSGKVNVVRRFDRVFQDPATGGWVLLEAKGPNAQKLTTGQQLVDRLLQENGGTFEIIEAAAKPPTSPKVRGVPFVKGFQGSVSPGSLQHVSGDMSTAVSPAAAGEVHSLNVSAWREGMNSRPDVPAAPGEVRYTRPNQPPAKLTQGQVAGVTAPAKKAPPSFEELPRPKRPPTRPGVESFEGAEAPAPRGGNPRRGPAGGKPYARVLDQTKPVQQPKAGSGAPEPTPNSGAAGPEPVPSSPGAGAPEPLPAAPKAGTGAPEPLPAGPKPGAGAPEPLPGAPKSGTSVPEPVPAGPKPGAGTPEPLPAGGAAPKVGAGARAAKIGIGALKMFGPAILDAINRYYMAKEESEKAQKLVRSTLEGAEVQKAMVQLIEKERLNIARKQLRGQEVFATASVTVVFTNNVIDRSYISRVELTDTDNTRFMSGVLRHEPLSGAEGSEWWVTSSVPLADVELSAVEKNDLELEWYEEQGKAPISLNEDEAKRLSEARNRALEDKPKLEKAEQQAKADELDRAGVLADEKKRAQQQAEINERLRRLAAQKKAAAPAKPAPAQPPAPAPPALLPAAAPVPDAAASLLPGASGPGPIEQAAVVVKQAQTWAEQLKRSGSALADRLGTGNSPSPQERQTWLNEEQSWRLAVKTAMNGFTNKSRSEAVNALGELVDRVGGKMKEIRTLLGG